MNLTVLSLLGASLDRNEQTFYEVQQNLYFLFPFFL